MPARIRLSFNQAHAGADRTSLVTAIATLLKTSTKEASRMLDTALHTYRSGGSTDIEGPMSDQLSLSALDVQVQRLQSAGVAVEIKSTAPAEQLSSTSQAACTGENTIESLLERVQLTSTSTTPSAKEALKTAAILAIQENNYELAGQLVYTLSSC